MPFTLFPYQIDGVKLLNEHPRCILGDDMGLGKTLQVLEATKDNKQILVVCPNSLKLNWVQEIKKHLEEDALILPRDSKTIKFFLANLPARIVICNYEQLIDRTYKLNAEVEERLVIPGLYSDLKRIPWDVVVLDEAHRVKNRNSAAYKAVRAICAAAIGARLYLVTGTPILNRVEELWTLFHLLHPSHFSSYWDFVKKYCKVEKTYFGTKVSDYGRDTWQAQDLRKLLSNMMIKRLKADVLPDLPEKLVKQIFVTLPPKQRKVYTEMERKMLADLDNGKQIAAPIVLAQLTRLKQIALSSFLVGGDKVEGAKLTALADILEDVPGSVVVYSQFKTMLYGLAKIHKDSRIISGDQSLAERDVIVQDFQAGKFKILLASTQACKEGLTLTKASVAIFLDKLWTPALNIQAQDRLHRIGQKDSVLIYEILAMDTIEQDIEMLLKSKQEIIDNALEEVIAKMKKRSL
jgi:SNF2 family DNA or RNA helicase